MKHLVIILLFSTGILLSSCKQEYKYEIFAGHTKVSDEIIKASNDSVAFCDAHRRFLILMQLRFDMKTELHPEIYHYTLISPEGKDISLGEFLNDPNKIIKENLNVFLSDEFKTYIANVKR
ncbi:hypothetical protein [Dysgonomonas sp. GY617]|uniref:hypothetical protein n=1 Tax=Dysgonomonas sp. GY617 TaxID=2780420 RepID=UPI0018831D57|nr:hypothetical protein [Dysgonomonas sp. GY617]MBF0577746.1 hypothetical protein [Dysgonomonas sp. GY617]